MDTLNDTAWDVLIAGTGLHESLLALALSKSGKKVLHVDRNDYYGGPDAALSLQDAAIWVRQVKEETHGHTVFSNASILIGQTEENTARAAQATPSAVLSFSRAYSIALSPHLIYAQSSLLSSLVSAKVDQQLEFLAVGNWWLYRTISREDAEAFATIIRPVSGLVRVPNGREDIFADQNIGIRSKRALMRFLRFLMDFENQVDVWESFSSSSFSSFLSSQFNLPDSVQEPLFALSLSSCSPLRTPTSFALPRVARHLRSIGVFGPGFGAVLPKWGGLAEIAQVACRAQAVGGGVYTLGNGIQSIAGTEEPKSRRDAGSPLTMKVKLKSGDTVTTIWVVSSQANVPENGIAQTLDVQTPAYGLPNVLSRSVSIVSTALDFLFRETPEGSPPPAAAVVVFPSQGEKSQDGHNSSELPPVHIIVHSSDTGECPAGQSVVYASVAAEGQEAQSMLERAVNHLLEMQEDRPAPTVLWKLQYEQNCPNRIDETVQIEPMRNVIAFPQPSLDLSFDDSVVATVKDAWQKIMGPDATGFMEFTNREAPSYHEDTEGNEE